MPDDQIAIEAQVPGAEIAATPDDWTPTERMSWFPVPAEADLDPRVADLVRRQREKLGAPNNVVRAHSWRPDLMLRWLDLYDYITRGPSGLSRIDREMIAVVVSSENRCMLCQANHSADLRRLTQDPVLSDRIALDYRRAGLDARTHAMLDYAVKITRTPVECNEADIESLRGHGFTDEDIYDIINTAAIYNFNNRVSNAAGFLPDRANHGLYR